MGGESMVEQCSDPIHRPMILTDIESSSSRPEYVRSRLQADMFELIGRVLAETGVDNGGCTIDERGDGALIVLPSDAPKGRLTDVLVHQLPLWLMRLAEQHNELGRLRLRLGLNYGDASRTEQGSWLSTAVDTLFRLVDSAPAKHALAAARDSLMVLIVSDTWFTDVIRPGLGDTFVSEFRPLTVTSHQTDFPAWIALPGSGSAGQPGRAFGDTQAGTEHEAKSEKRSIADLLSIVAASQASEDFGATVAWLRGFDQDNDADSVRRQIRAWATAEPVLLQAAAALAAGLRLGGLEPAEAATILAVPAVQRDPLVAAAVKSGCQLAAAGAHRADSSGAWVFPMLAEWSRHRDGRIRRVAWAALLDIATDLEREGDPDQAQADDGEQSAETWPGLLWFGELDDTLGRTIAGLWCSALGAPEFARPTGRILDLYARRAEPHPRRRAALARMASFAAAEPERLRRPLAERARTWVRGATPVAPLTGAMVLAELTAAESGL